MPTIKADSDIGKTMYYVSGHYCCTRYAVLTVGQDGNNDIVIANPAECVIVIIVGGNILWSVVPFNQEKLALQRVLCL